MTDTRRRPPAHVCAAFGTSLDQLLPLRSGPGWRGGAVVLRPVADNAEVGWLTRHLGRISLPDLRIAQPARSTDGRQIVGGWMAYRIAEEPEGAEADQSTRERPRFDDIVLTSVKLHQALADLPRPGFIAERDDVLAVADRLAWGEEQLELAETKGGRWFEILAGSAKPVRLPDQVVHADLYRSVRFAGDAPPSVIDFRPYYRPAEWGSALVVVDAIVLGGADSALIQRWSHLPSWPQMLLRAMLFRLAAHALNEESPESEMDGLRRAAGLVSEFV